MNITGIRKTLVGKSLRITGNKISRIVVGHVEMVKAGNEHILVVYDHLRLSPKCFLHRRDVDALLHGYQVGGERITHALILIDDDNLEE